MDEGKKATKKATKKTPMRVLSASAANAKVGSSKKKGNAPKGPSSSTVRKCGDGGKKSGAKGVRKNSSSSSSSSNAKSSLKNAIDSSKFKSSASNSLLKSTNWKENLKLSNGKAPAAIEFLSFDPVKIPEGWASAATANEAAILRSTFARYIGYVKLSIENIDAETVKTLTEQFVVAPYQRPEAKYSHLRGVPFNTDGEISTPQGQIPLSRLIDGQYNGLFKLSKKDKNLLETLFVYQRPDGSDWRIPFIRCATNHTYNEKTKELQIFVYVYFTRLIFELIADPAIKTIVDRIEGTTIEKTPATSLRKLGKKIFTSPGKSKLSKDIFKYSLAGLLKYAENDGYPALTPQPDGLSVTMFDFQLSTYQWMLDQEKDVTGLNARFWEKWTCKDGGGDMWYFKEAGEFRLTQPPVTTGGLLCEEMGLGKTLEVIAVVLGNPRVMKTTKKSKRNNESSDGCNLIDTKATLIVVPPTLVGQWKKEIHRRAEKLSVIDVSAMNGRGNGKKNGLSYVVGSCNQLASRNLSGIYVEPTFKVFDSEYGDQVYAPDVGMEGRRYNCKINSDFLATCDCTLDDEDIIKNHDVVLTTYNSLRQNANMFKKYHWHRIVCDECQELKSSTNQIASLCADLESNHRWMVSGTPFVSKVEDLHGELNFLKVWPFCLSNNKDGFWALKIGKPFEEKDPSSLKLLYLLIDNVMMRHSKGQRYIDGTPLVKIPPRTIEWRGFEIENTNELFVVKSLELFMAQALQRFMECAAVINADDNASIVSLPRYNQLKSLLSMMSKILSHPSAVAMETIDFLWRMLAPPARIRHVAQIGDEVDLENVPKLEATKILEIVRASGAGTGGTTNWASFRNLANVTMAKEDEVFKNDILLKSLDEIKEMMTEAGLPIPLVWVEKKLYASVENNSKKMVIFGEKMKETDGDEDEDGEASNRKATKKTKKRKRNKDEVYMKEDDFMKAKKVAREIFVANEPIRIQYSSDSRGDNMVKNYEEENSSYQQAQRQPLGTLSVHLPWEYESSTKGVPIYIQAELSRKEKYADLLLAHKNAEKAAAYNTNSHRSDMHSAGFETLYSLIAGNLVDCPLCMSPATRPVVTSCVHAFCLECIGTMLKQSKSQYEQCKCPICRKVINIEGIIEVDTSIKESENSCDDDAKVEGDKDQDEAKVKKETVHHISGADDLSSFNTRRKGSSRSIASSSSSSSSSSSTLSSSKKKCLYQEEKSESNFIIPELSSTSSAATKWDVDFLSTKLDYYHRAQSHRDYRYPTIEPRLLSVLSYMADLNTSQVWRSNKVSTRFKHVLEDMISVQKHNPFAKFVIFSQYKETLTAFQDVMNFINDSVAGYEEKPYEHKYDCVVIHSSTPPLTKKENLDRFNDDPDCNICLLTTGTAATGLTLTVAQTCYMLEPIQNAPEEAQALNRVHRIGQTEEVRCVIFYSKDSCEERLLASRHSADNLTSAIANSELEGDELTLEISPKNPIETPRSGRVARSTVPTTRSYAIGPEKLKKLFGLTRARECLIETENAVDNDIGIGPSNTGRSYRTDSVFGLHSLEESDDESDLGYDDFSVTDHSVDSNDSIVYLGVRSMMGY